ncbi:MAG: alpha/beta fold hydrolase [bacterium]|nr:alpha/beta fold hydrolase [bacterium]
MQDTVILVHGLASHPILMGLLARRLRSAGFRVRNWGYPSIRGNIARHSDRFTTLLNQFEDDPQIGRFHLVTHSMGGIVTRRALADYEPTKLGRVVMIAPPNRGSPVAGRLSPWLGWFCHPLSELADHGESFVNGLGTSLPRPVGVIACRNDRVVPIQSTHLPCEADHIILPTGHNSVLLRRDVAELAGSFLREGKFSSNGSHVAGV